MDQPAGRGIRLRELNYGPSQVGWQKATHTPPRAHDQSRACGLHGTRRTIQSFHRGIECNTGWTN